MWKQRLRPVRVRKRNRAGRAPEEKGQSFPGWILPPVQARRPLAVDLEKNLAELQAEMGSCPDLVVRRFSVGGGTEAALAYVTSLVDGVTVNTGIMSSLLFGAPQAGVWVGTQGQEPIELIQQRAVAVGHVQRITSLEETLHALLAGESVLLLADSATALGVETTGFNARNVEKPDTEVVVRGPREGFTETLKVNIGLLRRRLRTPDLGLEQIQLGERTGTDVCLAYIRGVASEELLAEVRRRLQRIKIDGVLESGYIENLIEDAPYSPFPLIGNTEKPDTVAAKLLEGRVAILVDGTPFTLTMPYLFVEIFQVTEDYYSRPFYTTIIRWIRYMAFLVSLLIPALIVAVKTFHPEILPPPLMLTMVANREGIPLPAFLEMLGMTLTFEILKEAGVRLPRPVGQAVSIVGALVLGESAVRAGLVSNTMVVAVGLMGISGFLLPPLADPVTVLRYGLLLFAATFGLPGLAFGFLAMLTHMAGLRSFGIPYLSPLAPANVSGWKDLVFRAPWWKMSNRPPLLAPGERRRTTPAPLRPSPPQDKGGGR